MIYKIETCIKTWYPEYVGVGVTYLDRFDKKASETVYFATEQYRNDHWQGLVLINQEMMRQDEIGSSKEHFHKKARYFVLSTWFKGYVCSSGRWRGGWIGKLSGDEMIHLWCEDRLFSLVTELSEMIQYGAISVAEANVELVNDTCVRIISCKMHKETRVLFDTMVREGVFQHKPKCANLPEAYYKAGHGARVRHLREAYSTGSVINRLYDFMFE